VTGKPSRGAVSPARGDFLAKLVHEVKMEVQNALQIHDLRKGLQERADLMATTGHLLVAPLDAAYGKTERLKFLVEEASGIAVNASRIAQLCDELDKDIVYCGRRTRSFMFFATMRTAAETYRFDRQIALTDTLEQCKQDFEHIASTREIAITLEPHGEIPPAHFDEEKLQIAFSNLLDNAVKYSHAKRVIRIELRYDKVTELYVASVSDFGLGIPAEEYETIFLPYARSKLQDPRRFIQGTGIGLSVVKQIIRRHGGKVWVTSRQGADPSGSRGTSSSVEGFNTTFWVHLNKRRKVIE
jgi:signal transduction histidine kinase